EYVAAEGFRGGGAGFEVQGDVHHLAVVVVMVHRHAAVFGHVERFVFGARDPRAQNDSGRTAGISRSSAASAGHRIAATADLAVFLTAVRLLPGAAGDDHADAFHVLEDGGRFTVPVGDADDDVVGVDGIVYIAQ